jgi:hypothetical protein
MERTPESGVTVGASYDESKLTDFCPEEKLGRPGEYPSAHVMYLRMQHYRPD